MDPAAPDVQDLRERLAASPFHASIGIEAVEASPGLVRLAIEARPEHRNLQGTVHGGLLATLADTTMGLAVRTAIEPGRRHVTAELSVHFLRPAAPGRIEALGSVVRVGATIAVAEADVRDERGDLLAIARGTYSVTPGS
jgi:acyl-CoA thioesterase